LTIPKPGLTFPWLTKRWICDGYANQTEQPRWDLCRQDL
jgi:hypothetical protein